MQKFEYNCERQVATSCSDCNRNCGSTRVLTDNAARASTSRNIVRSLLVVAIVDAMYSRNQQVCYLNRHRASIYINIYVSCVVVYKSNMRAIILCVRSGING